MENLSAFVGHSFLPEDKDVVRVFLDFFNTLTKSMSGFTWEDAEAPEPKELARKVQEKMKDKNVFIGLCTSREMVISPESPRNSLFNKDFLKAKRSDFSFKTSDWILAEIGYAFGRDMDLILDFCSPLTE